MDGIMILCNRYTLIFVPGQDFNMVLIKISQIYHNSEEAI